MSQSSSDLERDAPKSDVARPEAHLASQSSGRYYRVPFLAIIGLAIWYLARPEPCSCVVGR
jgi:hypothetical protein